MVSESRFSAHHVAYFLTQDFVNTSFLGCERRGKMTIFTSCELFVAAKPPTWGSRLKIQSVPYEGYFGCIAVSQANLSIILFSNPVCTTVPG